MKKFYSSMFVLIAFYTIILVNVPFLVFLKVWAPAYFIFISISEMAGRMESHALAFQEVLKHERGNLDEAMNQQKADMLQRYF